MMDIGEVIFIAQHETHHAIRAFFRPGSRGSWHSSGIGKAIAAYIAITDQKALFEKAPFEQFTQNTLVQEKELLEEFNRIRSLGYAVDKEERFIGMRCIGAPVFNSANQVVAGISILGRLREWMISRLPTSGKQQRSADKTSRGYSVPRWSISYQLKCCYSDDHIPQCFCESHDQQETP